MWHNSRDGVAPEFDNGKLARKRRLETSNRKKMKDKIKGKWDKQKYNEEDSEWI